MKHVIPPLLLTTLIAVFPSVAFAQAAERKTDEPSAIENSIGLKLVLIPSGEFDMGSTLAQIDAVAQVEKLDKRTLDYLSAAEQPIHRVRISKPFYLGQTEVTRGQFRTFVAATAYKTEAETDGRGGWGYDPAAETVAMGVQYSWRNPGFQQTDAHPVVNVTWTDAKNFCEWLSDKEGTSYRLPTEAEWEYACRAGTQTIYQEGDDPEALTRYGNVADGTGKMRFPDWDTWNTIKARDGYIFTAPSQKFRANGFGLYDMDGNVAEWCADWYEKEYYSMSPTVDPSGPTTGSKRVNRGGGWFDTAAASRLANRGKRVSSHRSFDLGFRVARIGPAK